jgi:hypothetical protein
LKFDGSFGRAMINKIDLKNLNKTIHIQIEAKKQKKRELGIQFGIKLLLLTHYNLQTNYNQSSMNINIQK